MTITQTEKLEGLKQRYAEMIVDGLDMNELITTWLIELGVSNKHIEASAIGVGLFIILIFSMSIIKLLIQYLLI